MELFYSSQISNQIALLDEQESRHCIKVLRHRQNDELNFTDGNGNIYSGKLSKADLRQCEITIQNIQKEEQRNFELHIAIAPTKAMERFEWFLEKAAELGVEEITPLLCRHSERKHLNMERCEKILISGMKQSNRSRKPKLNEMTPFNKMMNHNADVKAIAHCSSGDKKSIIEIMQASSLLLLIGPEGDFSEEEIKLATDASFIPLTLGDKRLRTETAAVHAASITYFLKN
ncbi:MAG: 16S rRNA (uracil(1498)-N(3))-methyltransferase [Bacteroidetes bacterium]|nr:MAG: RsmE family RNA methyltransferase [Bacteroidetes bacterium OLB10]MBV6454820.1 Ribosomal RNA small subunit methyltransferase E [Bacteroidia bacterium]MBX3107375.1 16S rRNA (uracil(1498)-N(3))-methyltransferase [Bacteroidota bacterium]MCB0848473.1 16S rRNA (uracil(1498)-N(3))-methyltransferase [Bacteroidota bacterium]MCB8930996.1 16S rRNA (uracil(1498)-N(3))-methyltransferase [Bacteroidia bacterium]